MSLNMEPHADRGDGAIGGSAFTGHGRPSPAFPQGRVCAEEGCGTRLSIYNDSDHCYLHEPLSVPRMRGKKIA